MGRNPENNRRMLDARNAQILEVAVELFARRGLSSTRIQDIAEIAGISQGLIYHYYKSKEEIFVAIIRNAFQLLNSRLIELKESQIAPEMKIKMAVEALLKGFSENRKAAWYHILIAHAGISEAIPLEAKMIIQEESRKPYIVMEEIIIAGQNCGTIGPGNAAQMALVFWTLIKGIALHLAVNGNNSIVPDTELLLKIFR